MNNAATATSSSKIISTLRFPLTFLVVVIHCRGSVAPINWTDFSAIDALYLVKACLSEGIGQLAVPAFFCISGYLFFLNVGRLDFATYREKMRRRFGTLLVPYVLWNLLCIPLTMLVLTGEGLSGTSSATAAYDYWHNIKWLHIFWDAYHGESAFTNVLGMTSLSANPILTSFWYIKDLIVMTVLAPLIYWLFRVAGRLGLVLVVVALVLRIWPHWPVSVFALFFAIGGYLGLNKQELFILPPPARVLNYALSIGLLLVVMVVQSNNSYWGWTLMPLFSLSGVFSVFTLAHQVLTKKPRLAFPAILGKSSFFVYAIHIEFSVSLAFFTAKTLFMHTSQPLLLILQYLVTPILAYAYSVALYWLAERVAPRLTRVLTGSR